MKDFSVETTELFGIGANILNLARSLSSISWDLKILALNGIVQAAKINQEHGQSLIALSDFLSGLPAQIAPELGELEELATRLSKQTTNSTMTIRRNNIYQNVAESIFRQAGNSSSFDFKKDIAINGNRDMIRKLRISDIQKVNLDLLIHFNILSDDNIKNIIIESIMTVRRAQNKIGKIQRHGFSATYMGTCLSIESAYLRENKANFISLVENIHTIVDRLNMILEQIDAQVKRGETLLLTYKN